MTIPFIKAHGAGNDFLLTWADRALIGEIDLNPIKVLPQGQGCVVVDALIAPLSTEKD